MSRILRVLQLYLSSMGQFRLITINMKGLSTVVRVLFIRN